MKLVADAHLPFIKDYFANCTDLILKPGRAITTADLQDADALLVRSITHVDENLLANTAVKFVGSVTAGADHLDTQWLESAGIVWRKATGFNAPPVADYVISVIAALQKKDLLRQKNLRAAVVGIGHVGKLVVERLQDLGFDLILSDPLRALHEDGFTSTALSELQDCDLITLHVPLIKSGSFPTYHFIDQAFLKRQKPGCVLLNASRGAVINTKDLLNHGRHLHWCFDVWEHEPRIDRAVLASALLATPHMAGYSVQSKMRGMEMMYQAMCDIDLIPAPLIAPCVMPRLQLAVDNTQTAWQDLVLRVFNPAEVTKEMCEALLTQQDDGHLFDNMRHAFFNRHEFAYTEFSQALASSADQHLLAKWGIQQT